MANVRSKKLGNLQIASSKLLGKSVAPRKHDIANNSYSHLLTDVNRAGEYFAGTDFDSFL